MRTSFRSLAVGSAILLAAASWASAETRFTANITHDQEVGVPNEGSSGTGVFILNDAQTRLTYDVTLVGLDLDGLQTPGNPNDNVTRIHFHRAPTGTNGGIVFGIVDASATLRNDSNPNDLLINPVTGHITGAWDLAEAPPGFTLASELPFLLANGLYFNVHTADHAGGEIRGQVLVPEPSTLLGLAAAAPLLLGRRRRK